MLIVLKSAGKNPLYLTGLAPDGSPRVMEFEASDASGPGISLLWARGRIAELERKNQHGNAMSIAKEFNILCRNAAFIAWDEEEVVAVANQDIYQPSTGTLETPELSCFHSFTPPHFEAKSGMIKRSLRAIPGLFGVMADLARVLWQGVQPGWKSLAKNPTRKKFNLWRKKTDYEKACELQTEHLDRLLQELLAAHQDLLSLLLWALHERVSSRFFKAHKSATFPSQEAAYIERWLDHLPREQKSNQFYLVGSVKSSLGLALIPKDEKYRRVDWELVATGFLSLRQIKTEPSFEKAPGRFGELLQEAADTCLELASLQLKEERKRQRIPNGKPVPKAIQ